MEALQAALKMAVTLIRGTASHSTGALTGYAGYTRYAELVCEDTDYWFPLNLVIACMDCNVYQDKVYVAPFLRHGKSVVKDKSDVLEECARIYDRIASLRREMSTCVADDPSTGERVLDKDIRRQYARCVYKIRDLEETAAALYEGIIARGR